MSETVKKQDWLRTLVRTSEPATDAPAEVQTSGGQSELLDALLPALEEKAHILGADRAQVAKALAMIDGSDGATGGSPIFQWLQSFYEDASSGKLSVSSAISRAREIFSLPAPAGLPTVADVWDENRNMTEIEDVDSLWDRILEGASSLLTNPIDTLGTRIDASWDWIKSSVSKIFGGKDE